MKNSNSIVKIAVILTIVIVGLGVALVVMNNNAAVEGGNVLDEQPSTEEQPTLGNDDAPVTVVEFGDFKCPACKAWGEDIFPQLVSDYVDTGKVKFSYINTLFHGEESKLGSMAAESVYEQNPDAYWEFHKTLFDEQPSQDHHSQWITDERILEVADGIKDIDVQQLESALEEQSGLEEVERDTELVEAFNVQMTPSIMINDIMVEDPFDYETIRKLIDQELGG